MRRKNKLLLTVILLIAAGAAYFIYPEIQSKRTPDFHPVFAAQPIPFNQQEDLHFYSDGWVVCSAPSRFYNWDQTEQEPPFTQDDLAAENNRIDIVAHTLHYIATANNRIYNTQSVPFELVYENRDRVLHDLKEYDGFLVLLIQEEESLISCPYILMKGSDFLIPLEGTGSANYVSVDVDETDLSLLTLCLDSPVPITRVFHYISQNELYGVLSLENQLLYNVYRMKNQVILIGIKDVLCYNVEGELQWSVSHESEGVFEALSTEQSLLLYFPEKSKLGESQGNALEVNEKGYAVKAFPRYLSNLNVFQSGYLAVESSQNLVFLNKNGKLVKKQPLQEPVDWMKYTAAQPDCLYVRTKDNVLHVYTTDKQEEDTE